MQNKFQQALRLHQSGDLNKAENIYREIIGAQPGHGDALNMLATVLCHMGRFREGVDSFRAACKAQPDNPEFLNNLGVALKETGDLDEAQRVLQQAIQLAPGSAEAHCNLGIVLGMKQHFDAAVVACKRALQLKPDYAKASDTLRNIYQQRIPLWHWPMMNDRPRNRAYEQAIADAVRPGMIVLDIGSGSGLLALMAAKAGAEHVYSCEMDPLVAEKAREIVKHNGYGDKVTIIAKNSSQLVVGQDMSARADLLVTETFDARVLGEGVVPIVNDAKARLLKPGAPVIPQGVRVYFQLLEGSALVDKALVGEVSGFDLRPFNEFRSTAYEAQLQLWQGWRGLTEVAEVMSFDFGLDRLDPQQRQVTLQVSKSGEFQAQTYWFQLDFGKALFIDSGPYAEDSHWKQMVQIESVARSLEAGQTVELDVAHNRRELMFRLRDKV